MQINIDDDIFVVSSNVEIIPVTLLENSSEIHVTVNDSSSGQTLPDYDGPYEIEPRKKQQILNTMDKAMTDNVIINKIAYTETGNESGGMTAIIGFE